MTKAKYVKQPVGASQVTGKATTSSTLLVGMPRTGKTSYLALLYCSLITNDLSDGPSLTVYDQDRAYLNRIAQRLQKCLPAERTLVGDNYGLSLALSMPEAPQPMMLEIPDLSGETWEAAHLDRVISEAISERAKNASGFMVFANAEMFRAVPTVEESRAAAIDLGLNQEEWIEREPSGTSSDPSSSQVALVDIIQVLAKMHGGPFRLSLILSAFDAVSSVPAVTPNDWVNDNAPLLAQYLKVNAGIVDSRIFGVSAQGGDYAADELTVTEVAEQPLLARAFVLDGGGANIAIHVPLLWALGDG